MPQLLRAYYQQKMKMYQDVVNDKSLNYKDLKVSEKELIAHQLQIQEVKLIPGFLTRNLGAALKTLSDEKLKQIYHQLATDKKNEHATSEGFVALNRRTPPTAVVNPLYFGCENLNQILDVYEEALGPELTRQVISAPDPKPDFDPGNIRLRVYRPFDRQLQTLINRHTNTSDPDRNAKNRLMLHRAGSALEDVLPEDLNAFHNAYKSTTEGSSFPGLDKIQGDRAELMKQRGFQLLADGKFDKLITLPTSDSGVPNYDVVESRFVRPLNEAELRELDALSRNEKLGLSKDTKDVLGAIEQSMNKLNYVGAQHTFMGEQYFPPRKTEDPWSFYYEGEQSYKYYAFWPVITAKDHMIEAVQTGNMEKLSQAVTEYRQAEEVLDQMMETLHSDKVSDAPIYSANVESTREESRRIPQKYALDYTNQNKLNSLNVAYLVLKNADLSMQKLMDDPVGTARKLGERILEAGGLDSCPESVGAALQMGMKNCGSTPSSAYLRGMWLKQGNGLLRGMAGIAGVEKDPDRRDRFLALVQTGLMQATVKIEEECRLYDTMQGVANGNSPQDQELRGLLYQHAALLPETGDGRFNQRELIERFSRGEKPDPVLSLLQTDYTQMFKGLAGRNEKVLADAALEQERSGSYHAAFDPDLYLLNAFSVQSRLVRQADQALRQDPDFAALRESLKNTWQLAKSPNTRAILKLGAEMLENPEAYNLLQTGKQDQLITSNSTEYTRMQQSLAKVQRVQRVLLEGKGQELERLSKTDFIKDLQKAKQEAFRYLRLKRDNGKKIEFHYESGKRRAEEAERVYGKLCRLQDALDLRSPAEKLYDEARMELMKHRASHRWLNEDARKHIAKMIYYKSLMDSGVPVEEQNLRLSPPHMDQKLELLNRYVKSITYYLADVIVLCDEAMEEKGSFRDRVSIYADHWKQRYQERNQPRFLQQAQEDLRMGYALDLAAKELGFSFKSNPQNFTPKNPRLHSKALEVKQRPEFREIVDRIIQGKSIQQLEGLHKPAKLDRSEEAQEAYARAENTVNLEKRCAKITAESMLLAKEGKEPSPEKLENAARVLRQDPRFQAYIREKTAPMTTLDIDKLYHNLSMEEVRNQVRDQVLVRLAEPQPIQNDRPIIQNPQVQNPVINPGNAALSQQGS